MSMHFGPLVQVGLVVRDLEAAMALWSQKLGVGPWFHNPDAKFADFSYKGKPGTQPKMAIAVANTGPAQIELIEQQDATPSIYLDFLRKGVDGQQHLAYGVTDFDASRARALADGWVEVQTGSSLGRLGYYVHPQAGDLVIELLEMNKLRAAVFDGVTQEAAIWDGSDPVRTVERLKPYLT